MNFLISRQRRSFLRTHIHNKNSRTSTTKRWLPSLHPQWPPPYQKGYLLTLDRSSLFALLDIRSVNYAHALKNLSDCAIESAQCIVPDNRHAFRIQCGRVVRAKEFFPGQWKSQQKSSLIEQIESILPHFFDKQPAKIIKSSNSPLLPLWPVYNTALANRQYCELSLCVLWGKCVRKCRNTSLLLFVFI